MKKKNSNADQLTNKMGEGIEMGLSVGKGWLRNLVATQVKAYDWDSLSKKRMSESEDGYVDPSEMGVILADLNGFLFGIADDGRYMTDNCGGVCVKYDDLGMAISKYILDSFDSHAEEIESALSKHLRRDGTCPDIPVLTKVRHCIRELSLGND